MANLSNTQYFKVKTEPEVQVKKSWMWYTQRWKRRVITRLTRL